MTTEEFRAALIMLPLLAISLGLWIHLGWAWRRTGWPLSFRLRRAVPWSPFEAVIVIVIVLFVVTAGLQQLFLDVPKGAETAATSAVSLRQIQVLSLSQTFELALIPFVISLWHLCYWSDFGVSFREWKLDLGIAVWGVVLAQLPIQLCQLPIQSLRSQSPHPILELLQFSLGDSQTLAWIILQVVILAPMIEELLFRVILQGALCRESSPTMAIGLSALTFVCIHQVVDWLPLFPLAIILGYVYYRRQSYLAVVVLHGLFNAINLILALATLKPVVPPLEI